VKRAVIIVAGGKGIRMGGELPKQFIPLHGKPVLMHTLEVFHRWDSTARIVLVLPDVYQSYWEMLCRELNCIIPHRIVHGGETRYHSTQNALSEVADCDLIGVHDGVRPFVSAAVIESCFKTAEEKGAVIPVVQHVDSLRVKVGDQSRAVDRSNYFIVQTPQVFRKDWLFEAYKQPWQPHFTEEASLVEASGKSIHLIEGNTENIKITTQVDLLYAKLIMEK
jgi:2-C-methyl-D-erythritol 4-phosphate cytidylyltransferase